MVTNDELAAAILQATAQEIGREVIKNNKNRSTIRRVLRLTNYIKGKEIEGYDISTKKCGCLEDAISEVKQGKPDNS